MKKNSNSKLAYTLQKRIKSINKNQNEITSELGTISANDGLFVDSIDCEIPKGDYSKCSCCSLLSDGDRVLLIWASGEPIIIDKIGG